jgi:hypothetical protein
VRNARARQPRSAAHGCPFAPRLPILLRSPRQLIFVFEVAGHECEAGNDCHGEESVRDEQEIVWHVHPPQVSSRRRCNTQWYPLHLLPSCATISKFFLGAVTSEVVRLPSLDFGALEPQTDENRLYEFRRS